MPMSTKQAVVSAPVGATATGNVLVEAPFDGVVSSVTYTPVAAVTGAASPASRTLALINHAQDGTGATSVASLALVGSVNLVAYDEKALTLSGTAANLAVAKNDILSFNSLAVTSGTGLADPGGTVEVVFTRNN
jgi:hypothetical protein